MYYAIQVIGCGKKQRFIIQHVIPGRGTNPTDGKKYLTMEDAKKAADAAGYEIAKAGDYWEII